MNVKAPTHPRQPGRTTLILHDGKNGPSATQSISFGQPLSRMNGSVDWQAVFLCPAATAESIPAAFARHGANLLILSRYGGSDGLDWITHAREAGYPIIYHIDDDLLAVPASLGKSKYDHYNHPDRLNALRANIEACDLLYTSTPALADRFAEHGITIPIIAGDVYCSVSPEEIGALIPPANGPVIGYMGTGGHSADLAMIMPAICRVMDAIPDLQFELLGSIAMPSGLDRYGHRIRKLPPIADYADFIPTLRSIGWWVGLAPLEDNIFNRCKADTKWVEYSLAGIATITSNLPVYQRALDNRSAIAADSTNDWASAMTLLLDNPRLRLNMIARAQRQLHDHYSHASLREQLLRIFDHAFALRRE